MFDLHEKERHTILASINSFRSDQSAALERTKDLLSKLCHSPMEL